MGRELDREARAKSVECKVSDGQLMSRMFQICLMLFLHRTLSTTIMRPQELIVSACGGETTATGAARSTSAPAIHTHDLLSGAPVQSFKTSTSSSRSVSYVPTQNDTGGAIFAVQEGKAIANVWAWQKVCLALSHHCYVLIAGPNAAQAALARKVELLQGLAKWVLGRRRITQWPRIPLGGELFTLHCL